ncbi:MAG: DUF898 family protein [Pseudomonadota bacterium]
MVTSGDEAGRPAWDLERYSVQNRQRERAAQADQDGGARLGKRGGKPGADDGVTAKDDGDWLAPAEKKARPRFVLSGELFWIGFTGTFLSVFTLGLYRFWMLTRTRRALAGSVRVENDGIEYTGSGFEKLIGFLIAVLLLSVYLAVANMALLFLGLVATDETAAFAALAPISLATVAPLYFWARYASIKYMVSRLSWRGIRLGMESGGFGFMLRSVWWLFLTVITLGIMYPYMHFKQAKYMTDRAHLGSLSFSQGGSWLGLLAYWIWFYIAAGLMFLAVWGIAEEMELGPEYLSAILFTILPFFVLIWVIMWINYSAGAFQYLWDNRQLGGVVLENDLRTGTIIWRTIKGNVLTSILTSIVGGLGATVIILTTGLLSGASASVLSPDLMADLELYLQSLDGDGSVPPPELDWVALSLAVWPVLIGIVAALTFFQAINTGFTNTLVVQPVLQAKVEAMVMRRPELLQRARQVERSENAEAGGFADALGLELGAGV